MNILKILGKVMIVTGVLIVVQVAAHYLYKEAARENVFSDF